MKYYIKSVFVIFFGLSLFSCQLNNTETNDDTEKKETEVILEKQEEPSLQAEEQIGEENPSREPTDEEIREYGIIKEIEDGAYPMFNITIEFPKREMVHVFYLNHGALTGFTGNLNTLKGKYISFYYLEEIENNLMDMFLDGKTLLGEYSHDLDPDSKSIIGTLSGAEKETQSDLPGSISITDKDGNKFDFNYYVDEAMVKANGKEVQAFYIQNFVSTITHITPSEEE